MNYARLALATAGGMVAYLVIGPLIFAVTPRMASEFLRHSDVYRSREAQAATMPAGMAAMLVAIFVVAVLRALSHRGPSGLAEAGRLGALIGVFVVCAFVMHNYMLLNVGLTLTLMQAGAYFVQWTVVGTVIGLLYRPAP